MSHFVGLVFTNDDESNLDIALECFDEQNEEYMEFVDRTEEVMDKFNSLPESCPSEGTFEEEIDRTDLVHEIWDSAVDELEPEDEDKIWRPYSKKEYPTPADIARDKGYEVVEDDTKRDGFRFVQRVTRGWGIEPSKEKFPTLNDLASKYFGYRSVNGKYGYMSNPNAKYDYYTEGGRWSGYLINKEGNETNEEFITEVDWEKMCEKDADGYTHIPFCFVDTDGKWIERGEMGWFAMVANEKKKDDWEGEFKEYINNLLTTENADRIVVRVVDFHI